MPEQFSQEDLEFEIKFYNGLIAKNPNFFEALVALGDLYTKAGMHEEGLAVDIKIVRLRPDEPTAHYNLACSYSLLKDVPKAFNAMKKAVDAGYRDFDHLERDQDLDNLRQDPGFKDYLARVKAVTPSATED